MGGEVGDIGGVVSGSAIAVSGQREYPVDIYRFEISLKALHR